MRRLRCLFTDPRIVTLWLNWHLAHIIPVTMPCKTEEGVRPRHTVKLPPTANPFVANRLSSKL